MELSCTTYAVLYASHEVAHTAFPGVHCFRNVMQHVRNVKSFVFRIKTIAISLAFASVHPLLYVQFLAIAEHADMLLGQVAFPSVQCYIARAPGVLAAWDRGPGRISHDSKQHSRPPPIARGAFLLRLACRP